MLWVVFIKVASRCWISDQKIGKAEKDASFVHSVSGNVLIIVTQGQTRKKSTTDKILLSNFAHSLE